MFRKNTNNYRKIFLSDAPLIDLRAPCEFTLGAFPMSSNLPLMSDQEREKVGIYYKKHGKEAAVKLGYQLVQGSIKEQRVTHWKNFAKNYLNTGYLYCFRGGLRSTISQAWLSQVGTDYPIVEGGYKAMRRYLIDSTEMIIESLNIRVITGLTGSAKTRVINQIKNSIDLEGLANHRGSSFGRQLTAQPTQINFENHLAVKLLKYQADHNRLAMPLYLEDESRLIGCRALPRVLKNKMDRSPMVLIEESFEYRVEQIFEGYVVDMLDKFNQLNSDNAVLLYANYLFDSTNKIKKRLGGQGLKDMHHLITQAIDTQKKNGELLQHKNWIIYLLKNYYDPMYRFQLEKKRLRVIFKGDTSEVLTYINSNKHEPLGMG